MKASAPACRLVSLYSELRLTVITHGMVVAFNLSERSHHTTSRAAALLRGVPTSFDANRIRDLVVRSLRNDVLLNQLVLGAVRPPVDYFLCVSIANTWKRHQLYLRSGIYID